MADDFIHVEVRDEELQRLLTSLRKKGQDFTPVTAEISNYLYNESDEAFDEERSVDGVPWQRLAPETIKAKGHDRILWDQGTMRNSLAPEHDRNKAIVGVNAHSDDDYAYPAVHQFGNRPFLPFDADNHLYSETEDEILTIVKEFLKDW